MHVLANALIYDIAAIDDTPEDYDRQDDDCRALEFIVHTFSTFMKKVNVAQVPAEERQSPGGKYAKTVQEISVALGRQPHSLDLAKRHPFDLALVRIPPGKSYCPYHSHGAESELYLVVSGRGSVRDKDGTTEVTAGEAFFFGPGEAHQLSNHGSEDFAYYVIADNPRHDSCYYPDSGKWAVTKEGSDYLTVQGTETDYYKGEE